MRPYEEPEVEIIIFESEDVITGSTDDYSSPWLQPTPQP